MALFSGGSKPIVTGGEFDHVEVARNQWLDDALALYEGGYYFEPFADLADRWRSQIMATGLSEVDALGACRDLARAIRAVADAVDPESPVDFGGLKAEVERAVLAVRKE